MISDSAADCQLAKHICQVQIKGLSGNNERSVIDLKGAFKLIMMLPKAGLLRSKMAEVIRGLTLVRAKLIIVCRICYGSLAATRASSRRCAAAWRGTR